MLYLVELCMFGGIVVMLTLTLFFVAMLIVTLVDHALDVAVKRRS